MNSKFGLNSGRSLARKRDQKGLTLVELSIALAIGAVITIIGVIFANDALKESRISSEAARVNSIVMKARTAFQNTAYSNLQPDSTVPAARLGVFPKDMINTPNQDPAQVSAANQITNRWGGAVVIGRDATSRVLRVIYPNVPQDDCVEFVNRVESLFTQIHGDATDDPIADAQIKNGDGAAPVPFSVANLAIQGCENASNTLTFAFRK